MTTGAQPGAVRGILHAAGTGLMTALAASLWQGAEAVLSLAEYRRDPMRVLDLMDATLSWYAPLMGLAIPLLALAIRALRARREVRATAAGGAPLHAGLGAALFLFVLGLGTLTGPAREPLEPTLLTRTGLGLLLLTCAAAAWYVTELADRASRSEGLRLSIQTGAAVAVALIGVLVAWSLLREHLDFEARSLIGILAAAASVLAGLGTGLISFFIVRRGAHMWWRLGAGAAVAAALVAALSIPGLSSRGLAAEGEAAGKRPNVLFIVADTLRADRVGAYGAARTTTPVIDALAGGGVRFARATAAASWTFPATASLLTGLYPSDHGLRTYKDAIRPDAVSLAAILRHAGYATAGFVTNPILTEEVGFGSGFDLWEPWAGSDWIRRHDGTSLAATLRRLGLWSPPSTFTRAGPLVDRALEWLDGSREEPFLLYVHFMDPHDPYAPPPPFDTMYGRDPGDGFGMTFGTLPEIQKGTVEVGPADLESMLALYDGAVTYMDGEIGRLLDAMRARGLLDDTLVVFVSDHGEEFIEHGGLGHEHTLYEELIRVPLILSGPGIAAGRVIEEPVSQVDVTPTILEAVGIEPPVPMDGISLWRPASLGEEPPARNLFFETTYIGARYPVHALMGLRRGSLKLIGSSFHARGAEPWNWELYDLEEDPLEARQIQEDPPERLDSMRAALLAWAASRRTRSGAAGEVSDERLELLKSLGYVE